MWSWHVRKNSLSSGGDWIIGNTKTSPTKGIHIALNPISTPPASPKGAPGPRQPNLRHPQFAQSAQSDWAPQLATVLKTPNHVSYQLNVTESSWSLPRNKLDDSHCVLMTAQQRGTKANTIGYWHRTIYLVTPGGWAICMSMKSTFFLWISAAAVLSMSRNQNWYFFRLSKENIMWQDLSLLHLQYASKDPRQTGGSCYTQVFGMSW